MLVLPLSHNLMFNASGGHRAKVTSENENGLYLSLYDLAQDQRDTQRRFEVPSYPVVHEAQSWRSEPGRRLRYPGEDLLRTLRYQGVIKRQRSHRGANIRRTTEDATGAGATSPEPLWSPRGPFGSLVSRTRRRLL